MWNPNDVLVFLCFLLLATSYACVKTFTPLEDPPTPAFINVSEFEADCQYSELWADMECI